MTNIDFLSDFIKRSLTPAWGKAEIAKPFAERHPVMQWYDQSCRFQAKQPKLPNGLFMVPPHAPTRAYYTLAHDLFTLSKLDSSHTRLLERIKNPKTFQGARHELFAISVCARAGFDIAFEDETDGTKKHAEFVATHRTTGQHITAEAKSKHRAGVLGFEGVRVPDEELNLSINRLLITAFQKPHAYPFVVFFDLNLPHLKHNPLSMEWFDTIAGPVVRRRDRTNEPDPWNLLLLSDCPDHYADDETPLPRGYVNGLVGKNPALTVDHPEALTALFDTALEHGKIPEFLDGM
jgi:hypothetical protein